MSSIVITGGDGFVGSHLARSFAKQGIDVYALTVPDSPTAVRIQSIPGITVLQRNLADIQTLSLELPQNPMAFIHLAWDGVSPKGRNGILSQKKNIDLSLRATELAAKLGAKKFIFPGSTMEYSCCTQPINSKSTPSPQNAYGAAKISARYMCEIACKELHIPFVYVVITGIYAADRRDNNVIYYVISELLNKRRPMLTSLEQIWDYVYIDDVVRAFYLIAEKGKPDAFYGIGHGDNWALSNYIYQIRDIIDPSLPLGVGEIPYASINMPSSCVDMTSLKNDTGFVPQVPFEVGIRKVIETMKKQQSERMKGL